MDANEMAVTAILPVVVVVAAVLGLLWFRRAQRPRPDRHRSTRPVGPAARLDPETAERRFREDLTALETVLARPDTDGMALERAMRHVLYSMARPEHAKAADPRLREAWDRMAPSDNELDTMAAVPQAFRLVRIVYRLDRAGGDGDWAFAILEDWCARLAPSEGPMSDAAWRVEEAMIRTLSDRGDHDRAYTRGLARLQAGHVGREVAPNERAFVAGLARTAGREAEARAMYSDAAERIAGRAERHDPVAEFRTLGTSYAQYLLEAGRTDEAVEAATRTLSVIKCISDAEFYGELGMDERDVLTHERITRDILSRARGDRG
jgi:hypothetical protein